MTPLGYLCSLLLLSTLSDASASESKSTYGTESPAIANSTRVVEVARRQTVCPAVGFPHASSNNNGSICYNSLYDATQGSGACFTWCSLDAGFVDGCQYDLCANACTPTETEYRCYTRGYTQVPNANTVWIATTTQM